MSDPLTHHDPTIQAAIESGMNCFHCRASAVQQVTAKPPFIYAHWACPRCDSTFNQWEYPRVPTLVLPSKTEAQTMSTERVAPQKGQSQLEVKATLRHRDQVNDTVSVTFDAEPSLEALERYTGWVARILDSHATQDRILEINMASVWKMRARKAERAVDDMRAALIKFVNVTRLIGEQHQPDFEDWDMDVEIQATNGDCRRIREAWEAAMAALETHPINDDDQGNDKVSNRGSANEH